MKNWKYIALSLSALALMACSQQTEIIDENASDEATTESVESSFEASEAPTVENIDGGSESEEDESQETESTDASSAEEDVASTSGEPADAKDENIIDLVKSKDTTLPADAQFSVSQISDTEYQIEVRQDGPDGAVSNMIAIYQYHSDTDELLKQDPTTGEFVAI